MQFEQGTFEVSSTDRFEILNVTPEVEAIIEETGVTDGLVNVSTPHTSAALSTNEFEEKLLDDMIDKVQGTCAAGRRLLPRYRPHSRWRATECPRPPHFRDGRTSCFADAARRGTKPQDVGRSHVLRTLWAT